MPDELIYFGSAVKALGDGRVGGYLVEFTDYEAQKGTPPDLVKEFFTKSTDYDIEPGEKRSVYFDHGQDPVMKRRRLGKAELKTDDVGLWAETILDTRDKYLAKIYELAEQGKLGWSSGSAPHLVEKAKKSDGFVEITAWPIAEASLTHRPCNPFSAAIPMKAFVEELAEAKGTQAVKGLLLSKLAEEDRSWWRVQSAFCDVIRDVANAYRSQDVLGVTIDVEAKVDEAFDELKALARPSVVSQIREWKDSPEEYFYLKSIFDELTSEEEGARAALKFSDDLEVVLAAAREVQTRAKSIQEMRVKAGRVLSEANRSRLATLLESLRTCTGDIETLLAEAEPKPKSADPDEVLSLVAQFEEMKFRATTSRS